MEELVSAIHGVEFALWSIWILLFLILMFKDCNGSSSINGIKKQLEELISVLMKK